VLIANDSCGTIYAAYPMYSHITATYTPATTGVYSLEIYNYRNATVEDLQNYIDNITMVPQTTDFYSDTNQFSASAPSTANLTLDAGVTWANWKYFVGISVSGNWPGMNSPGTGVWAPFNYDSTVMTSYNLANGGMLQNTKSVLDASGQGSATISLPAMGPGYAGRTLNVFFILYAGAFPQPWDYGSMPLSITFLP